VTNEIQEIRVILVQLDLNDQPDLNDHSENNELNETQALLERLVLLDHNDLLVLLELLEHRLYGNELIQLEQLTL
jgi:hypothetical protein